MYELILSFWLSVQSAKNQNYWNIETLQISPIENIIDKKRNIDSKAWAVFDLKSWAILWWKNEDVSLPMASLTKLMTALLIIENHKFDEIVTISKEAANTIWASIWLKAWEKFTVQALLEWLLIPSWNDVAIALAQYHSWNVNNFVKEMNEFAFKLNLTKTNFENPTWFDSPNHYSSVKDLSFLASRVLKNSFIKETVSKQSSQIFSEKWRSVSFVSTNHLLWWEIKWVKTWTTPAAWQCLITLIEKDQKEFLFVLLWSTSRFATTTDLIDFVFSEI